jgi:hypothetical protein
MLWQKAIGTVLAQRGKRAKKQNYMVLDCSRSGNLSTFGIQFTRCYAYKDLRALLASNYFEIGKCLALSFFISFPGLLRDGKAAKDLGNNSRTPQKLIEL